MATVIVATSEGCRIFSEGGEGKIELAGRQIGAIVPDVRGSCLAVVDGKEIWRRSDSGGWSRVTTTTVNLNSILAVGGKIFGGSSGDAIMVRIAASGETERLLGFDEVPGRSEWFGEGPPLHVRALTATADGNAIMAAVHVGGVPRSSDGGKIWTPTIPIKYDAHEVRAHPTSPNIVVAATGVGLCVSEDAGRNWNIISEGVAPRYKLAVAFINDEVLFSVQDGPFAERSQIWRWPIGGKNISQVREGLPEWLQRKVDTAHIAAGEDRAAVLDRGGNLWLSKEGSRGWERLATGLKQTGGLIMRG